jgi:hypothetical protein
VTTRCPWVAHHCEPWVTTPRDLRRIGIPRRGLKAGCTHVRLIRLAPASPTTERASLRATRAATQRGLRNQLLTRLSHTVLNEALNRGHAICGAGQAGEGKRRFPAPAFR